ncbi:MAG: bifunctional 4-hydroxy-3-methylbut-2-enyl diphosphate reductase/30S ribosomal protein S1 [Clostridia bacterium]|nr:bifunctional 4-hydroxy-3-methylbut-2-enyl diphosphate reductase/30S ribosomal protein S1 [Clostridia bacterium]
MAEIIRAEHSGFCFGVRRAITKTEEAVKNHTGSGKIYTCGPLIHNKFVTDRLKEQGVDIIYDLDEAGEEDTVIVRSHGEAAAFYDKAASRGITLTDATCPFVEKIHQLVHEAASGGSNVLIVGDKDHPEVQGINGWCGNNAVIINSPEEAANLDSDNFFVVAQTTIRKSLFDDVIAALESRGKKFEVRNTICSATQQRQDSCINTAKNVDVMIVIGGRDSSNTRKLYEISKKFCEKTYFVENKADLPLKEVKFCNRIGLTAGASTPECVIEEVIANMSEVITENKETNLMAEYMDEIEKQLRLPRAGEIVNGKIHQVTDKEIIVNLGCKKDGIIPKEELTLEGDQKLKDLFKEGDEIQAKVIKTDDGDGTILLSKKKLEVNEHWDEINSALEDKSTISVKVVKQVNGGVIAAYKEVSGFIPLSQLSDKFVESAEEFLGQVLTVKVSRVDQKRGKAVFSHKAVLAEERAKKIEEIWSKLNVGDVVEGTIMRFTDYGAFVDVGGIDGLLHISEISWGKLKHPQEVLSIGQKIQVKVLSMNAEKGKISLGMKQNKPEPWSVIDENYQIGQVVAGKVVQIKEYGAFVELEPGLDGLVHISEVAHKRVTNINDELQVGQEVSAKILDIDKERKRISLSIKETLEAPVAEEAADEAAEEAADEE